MDISEIVELGFVVQKTTFKYFLGDEIFNSGKDTLIIHKGNINNIEGYCNLIRDVEKINLDYDGKPTYISINEVDKDIVLYNEHDIKFIIVRDFFINVDESGKEIPKFNVKQDELKIMTMLGCL